MSALRPPGSLADRIHRLRPDLRQRYDFYVADMAAFITERPNGQAYADWIDGLSTPELPYAVREALGFVDPPRIPVGTTTEGANEIYRNFLEPA